PPSRIWIEATLNNSFDGRIQVLGGGRKRSILGRTLSSEHFRENHSERVDVASHGHFATVSLLGRHVRRSAAADVAAGNRFRHGSKAEVHDEHLAAAVDHNVGRFQIAMQYASLMRSRNARTETS